MAKLPSLTALKSAVESSAAVGLDQFRNMVEQDREDVSYTGAFAQELETNNPAETVFTIESTTAESEVETIVAEAIPLEQSEPLEMVGKVTEEHIVGTTRSEMVQQMVDTVFDSFSLSSLNVDFFGEFAVNMVPTKYYVQTVGKHSFFVKKDAAISLASIIPLMDKVRSELKDKKVTQIPLVYRRNIEGAIMRALVVTELEIKEIGKSFPDLQFGYSGQDGAIDDIRLMVKAGR